MRTFKYSQTDNDLSFQKYYIYRLTKKCSNITAQHVNQIKRKGLRIHSFSPRAYLPINKTSIKKGERYLKWSEVKPGKYCLKIWQAAKDNYGNILYSKKFISRFIYKNKLKISHKSNQGGK